MVRKLIFQFTLGKTIEELSSLYNLSSKEVESHLRFFIGAVSVKEVQKIIDEMEQQYEDCKRNKQL